MAWTEAHLPTKWHLDPSSHLATTDMGRKLGSCAFYGGARSPSNTIWTGPRPTYIPSVILIHPAFWLQYMGRKWGLLCPTPFSRGEGVGSWVSILQNAAWAEAYLVPSDILIHPAVWPQQTWSENWGLCPFLGGRGSRVPI